MYIITYKDRPVTIEKLYSIDGDYNNDHDRDNMFITGKTKKATIETFLYYRGWTWKERTKHVDVKKVRI